MRILLAMAAILFGALVSVAHAQNKVGMHLEECTEWRDFNGSHYTRNVCNRAVTVFFMTLDGKNRIERHLQRNEPIDTGILSVTAKELGWIGATCPVGFRPDVPFTPENRQRFFDSYYDCVPG